MRGEGAVAEIAVIGIAGERAIIGRDVEIAAGGIERGAEHEMVGVRPEEVRSVRATDRGDIAAHIVDAGRRAGTEAAAALAFERQKAAAGVRRGVDHRRAFLRGSAAFNVDPGKEGLYLAGRGRVRLHHDEIRGACMVGAAIDAGGEERRGRGPDRVLRQRVFADTGPLIDGANAGGIRAGPENRVGGLGRIAVLAEEIRREIADARIGRSRQRSTRSGRLRDGDALPARCRR